MSGDIPYFFGDIAAAAFILYIFNHTHDRDRCVRIISSLTDEPATFYAVGISLAVFYLSRTGLSEQRYSIDPGGCACAGRIFDHLPFTAPAHWT